MIEILTTIFFVFAVIDPIGTIPVYLEATKEFDLIHKKKIAIRASIIAFCGASIGYVVAVYNHNDGTECRNTIDTGTSANDAYLPTIYNGSSIETNLDGEVAIKMYSNNRLYITNFNNVDTFSLFLMCTRTRSKMAIYFAGTNQYMFIADSGGSWATFGQFDTSPISAGINGIDFTPHQTNTLAAAMPTNNPLILSAMRFSPNSTWGANMILGGYVYYSRGFDSHVTGEVWYDGDKSTDEAAIITELTTQFNIT